MSVQTALQIMGWFGFLLGLFAGIGACLAVAWARNLPTDTEG